nr:uncharacterized protein LOC109154913 [Ipomoea trifida]
MEFEEGDNVLLKLWPHHQSSVQRRIYHKLAPRYYGSYIIKKKLSAVAYKLALPTSARIHPVFHVSQLRRVTSHHPTITELPADMAVEEQRYIPKDILGTRLKNGVPQDVSGTQVPRQSQSNNVRKCAETQNIGLKPTQMKRKRRQSGGAAQLSSQLDSLISNSNRALDVLIGDSTVNTQSTTTVSLAVAISVINRMVTDGIMEKGGDLWCFSLSFLKDDLNREIFSNIDDDFSRKAWLKYMHDTSK